MVETLVKIWGAAIAVIAVVILILLYLNVSVWNIISTYWPTMSLSTVILLIFTMLLFPNKRPGEAGA